MLRTFITSALGCLPLLASEAVPVVQIVSAPTGLPEIPWFEAGALARLGEVRRPDGRMLATIHGAWSTSHLHLEVVVDDADHVPAPNGQVMWSADSVEIGLDLAGDGAGGLPAQTTGPIGNDDVKVILGLIADGTPALAILASRQTRDAAVLAEQLRIEREGARTIYRLQLPWGPFGLSGGATPTIGLDVQINDRNAGEGDKTPYQWGEGLRGGFTAGALRQHVLGTPRANLASAAWTDTVVWSTTGTNRLQIGVRSDETVPVELQCGKTSYSLAIPGGPGLRHVRVDVPVQPDGSDLIARIAGQPDAVAIQTAAAGLHRRLTERLSALAAQPDIHPLFARHLASLESLVHTDWGRVRLLRDNDRRRALTSLDHMRTLLAGLDGEAGQWSSYLDGRRSLVMSYVSPHDQSVQYYYLGLPRDREADRAYPLFFELHGAGDDHPLSGPASRLGLNISESRLHGYATPQVQAESDRTGYWVYPFGRGNLGYGGIARIDILEAYDHVHSLVRIDADRRYLYGFSMGSAGTYSVAMHTASRWAACCAMSGAGMRGEPLRASMVDNLRGLPFKILCGSADGGVGGVRSMIEAMQARGLEPEARIIEGLGHVYTREAQIEMIEWLKTHVRHRPSRFAFTVSDNLTNEQWGVRLPIASGIPLRGGGGPARSLTMIDDDAPALAHAEVVIDGQTVTITSRGTQRVLLDFSSPDGLGMSGDVVVHWNGTEAYRGPAKPLTLE